MKTMKKTMIPALSLLLSLLMALYLFPLDVAVALAAGEPEGLEPEISEPAGEEETFVDALFELTEQRTADTKYIRMSDGTVKALVYGSAVHRADEDGVWREIDNSLTEKEGSVESDRVSFVKTVSEDGALYTLTDGEKRISVSLAGAQPDTPVTVTNDGRNEEKFETKLEELSTLTKLVSSLRYEDVLPKTDLEYILHGNDLKENIIINDPAENYTYSFILSLENLTAQLSEDGSVALNAGEERAYVFPAPYMVDAEGEYSDAVSYALEDLGDGRYLLTVTADEEWIGAEERAFPVTVDPTVVNMNFNRSMEDTYTYEGVNANYSSSIVLYVGYKNNKYAESFYSFHHLPQYIDLPLISAVFNVTVSSTLEYADDDMAALSLYSVGYISDLSGLYDSSTVTNVRLVKTESIVAGQTTYTFDILNSDFLISLLPAGHATYRLNFDNTMWGYLSIQSIEYGYRPTLVLSYGYSVPEEILSTSVSAHNEPFTLTNNYTQVQPGCKMLLTSGTSLYTAQYDSMNTASRLCFVRTSSSAYTVKICYYGSGKYLSTVSSSAGAPVNADPYGDWDSWTVIRLNDGAMIIRSTSCSNMVLTRRMLPNTQIESVCVDYLSDAELENQLWRLADPADDGRTIDTGIYYINSNYSKQFLVNSISNGAYSLDISSATESVFGNKMAWMIAYIGNGKYMIQSMEAPNYYLSVGNYAAYIEHYTAALASRSVFTITQHGTWYTIKSEDGYNLTNSLAGGISYSESNVNDAAKWRLCNREDYHEIEFAPSSKTDFSVLMINNQYADITANGAQSYTYTDFSNDFSYSSDNIAVVSFANHTVTYGRRTDGYTNVTNVTATHIPTGKQKTYRLWVGNSIFGLKSISQNKRMSAQDANSILMTDLISDSHAEHFGEQLWYTEYAETVSGINYYYIHSLHVRDSLKGDNSVLTLEDNSGNLVIKLNDNNFSSNKKWTIYKTNAGYVIESYYGSLYLAIDTDGTIIIDSEPAYWTFEGLEKFDFPNCNWNGTYNDGQTVHDVYIHFDDSIKLGNGIIKSVFTGSGFQSLFTQWNTVTNRIVIHNDGTYNINTLPSSAYIVTFTVVNTTEYWGKTFGNGEEYTEFDDWDTCTIKITNEFDDNYFAEYNKIGNPLYSAEEQQQAAAEIILIQKELERTILHELGHALKQSHTFSEARGAVSWIRYHSYSPYIVKYETEVLSVMNYTPPQIYEGIPCETYCVSVLDKYNLIVKWGISS